MSKTKLDLSKFKHVKSDDKSTTLQHKDGHVMTIMHGALGKDAQAQLGALKPIAKEAATPLQKNQAEDDSRSTGTNPKSREDVGWGKVTMKAEGGEVKEEKTPKADTNDCIIIRPDTGWGAVVRCGASGGDVEQIPKFCAHCGGPAHVGDQKMYAEGTDSVSPDDKTPASLDLPSDAKDTVSPKPHVTLFDQLVNKFNENTAQAEAQGNPNLPSDIPGSSEHPIASYQAQQPVPTPDVSGASQEAAAGQTAPASDANAQAPQQAMPAPGAVNAMDPQGMFQSGLNERLAGIQGTANAQGALGEEQAKQLNETVKAQEDAKAAYQQHFNDLDQERNALVKDVQDGHIDPNKFWTGDAQGNGGHSKMAAGIGMILAGFNPTNRPNAAIDYLKNQMDMNLKAQERNLSSKETLLHSNLQQFGNLKDATMMTQIMQKDLVANELSAAAAKAQTPMAKAAALQAAGQLKMEATGQAQQFAMMRAMGALSTDNPKALDQTIQYLRIYAPDKAKEIEGRYVPGVGLGKVPVPEGVRQELVSHEKLQNVGQDLLDYTKKHTNINPLSAEYKVGAQKALILQQAVREGMLGTVFRESEKPLLETFVNANPANALKMFTTMPKLKTLLESNQMQANTLKKTYGLPVKESIQDSEPVKGKDGRMYKKSPDGKYMIPVGG